MVNEHDPFPKSMCHRCSFKVDEFFEFRSKCIKAQEYFKRKVPWLRDKQPTYRNEGEPPMVEVTLNSVNAVSPNEKEISPLNGTVFVDENMIVIDDDSPPYNDHSQLTDIFASDYDPGDQNQEKVRKPKKSKPRSIWASKKRKKRKYKSCRITEVFTTTEHEYQNIGDIENDPLRLSPVDNCENNSLQVKSPKNEHSAVEKGILTDDKGGANIALPKHILVTNIPRTGNVYTCERCGRTFLNPQSATLHTCSVENSVEDNRPKEEPREIVETDTSKDFYDCSECGQVFTRHSQLISHKKKHSNDVESSSDDNFEPFNIRKKHHRRKKSKQRLLHTSTLNATDTFTTTNTYNTNNYFMNFGQMDTGITRHSLLSSDSE